MDPSANDEGNIGERGGVQSSLTLRRKNYKELTTGEKSRVREENWWKVLCSRKIVRPKDQSSKDE